MSNTSDSWPVRMLAWLASSRWTQVVPLRGQPTTKTRLAPSYSSGMGARLAFAICAHVDADILIIDEVTSVGDQAFQAKCEEFILGFARKGTLLIVTHALDYLVQVCDRVLWIEDGYIRDIGEPKTVLEGYRLAMSGG